jgi:predicted DNA-binding transcriptional regulator
MSVGIEQTPVLSGCEVLPPMETTEVADQGEEPEPKRKVSRRKTGHRFAVLNLFVDTIAGDLNRSDILVWLVLYRDTRDGTAKTSQADIARRTKLSERTVRYAICRLEKRGLLKVVYRGGINRGPSIYRVLVELES